MLRQLFALGLLCVSVCACMLCLRMSFLEALRCFIMCTFAILTYNTDVGGTSELLLGTDGLLETTERGRVERILEDETPTLKEQLGPKQMSKSTFQ